MYIEGHKQIVKDALKSVTLPDDIKHGLKEGVAFPDMACKQFVLRNNRIELIDSKTCSILKLFKTLHGKEFGFSTIYQFHRGALGHLHSMAPSNTVTLETHRLHILDLVLSILGVIAYGGLGFNPKSAFWVGVIIHTMTDSYPRGHTVRKDFETDTLVQGADLPLPKIGKTKQVRQELTALVQNIAKKHVSDPDELLKLIGDTRYNDKKRSLYRLYLMYRFLRSVNHDANKYRSLLRIPKNLGIDDNAAPYELLHFQNYEIQDSYMHKKEDLLSNFKEHPIYNRIISEVSSFLKIYLRFLEDKLTAEMFIKEAYTLIATTTFQISKRNRNNLTGMPKHGIRV